MNYFSKIKNLFVGKSTENQTVSETNKDTPTESKLTDISGLTKKQLQEYASDHLNLDLKNSLKKQEMIDAILKR